MPQRYKSFNELKRHEILNRDYRILVQDLKSNITIIAPHGGKIEPNTSEIAKHIAADTYNYYCFEGIKPENNGRLHITSHRFDEPTAIGIITRSDIVVAIHACKGNLGMVYIGGLHMNLKHAIAEALTAKGICVSNHHPSFKGANPNNICNRGINGKGVQLEISRDLRDDENKRMFVSDAVKDALNRIHRDNDGIDES